ncbi:MAG: hypothetical protein R6W06_13015 [Prochlorococcaceae cyanobacterium]
MHEAYAAVERAYSQGRYDTALQQAQALLATLDATPDASADEPLRPRLLLLMGHCHLYGLADPQQAAAAYRDVLERCNEPVLREIAEESLGRCTTGAPAPAPASAQARAATPWLEQSTSTSNSKSSNSTSNATSAQPAAARPQAELPLQAPFQQLAVIKSQPEPLAVQEPLAQAEPEPQVEPEPQGEPEPEPKPELIIPELVSEPEEPARPSSGFSPEEEEDLARGLLLVEL